MILYFREEQLPFGLKDEQTHVRDLGFGFLLGVRHALEAGHHCDRCRQDRCDRIRLNQTPHRR
jgi:hypothetical protein